MNGGVGVTKCRLLSQANSWKNQPFGVQYNLGNSNSEGKQKTVRNSCVSSYWGRSRNFNTIRYSYSDKLVSLITFESDYQILDLFFAQIKIKLLYCKFKKFNRFLRQEELMGWCPWWVARTRILVTGVYYDKGKRDLVRVGEEFDLFQLEPSKIGEKWGQLQGKWDLAESYQRFELPGFYSLVSEIQCVYEKELWVSFTWLVGASYVTT